MKQIIIALGLIAIMHTGAQAKDCNCKCKTASVTKHTTRAHRPKMVAQPVVAFQTQQTVIESCHVVPYEVCKINPDRRSVSCYKSIDPEHEQPYTDEVTTYGAIGLMPGQATRPAPGTIILNAPAAANYCKRNADDNATICYSPGNLVRDEFGFYHYK